MAKRPPRAQQSSAVESAAATREGRSPELQAEMHRARNMLGALLLNAGIIADHTRPEELRLRARERLKKNVDDLAALLEKLPDLARRG